MECANEIGQIAKSDIVGDVGNRSRIVSEQPRSPAQSGAHQVLVRGYTQDPSEESKEVKRAEAELLGCAFEIDRLMRVGIDPERGFHRAAALTCPRFRRSSRPSGDNFDKARRE
jgi:hypothetical protein